MTEINNIEKEELEWLEMEALRDDAEEADRSECSDNPEAYDD